MQIYPHNSAIILNDSVFVQNGGLTGTFSSTQLQSSYWLAEMQVSSYIGTLLLPTIVTGTFGYMGSNRIATDYGYVSQIYSVNIQSKQAGINCTLQSNSGCVFIWNDTFGYLDFRRATGICGCSTGDNFPYQIQITYKAGLPSGTANQPGILTALTIVAQINLNESFPGVVGVNESVGAIGVQQFKALDYMEKRADHALIKTSLGDDAKSQRARKLIDMSIRKARRVLFA